MSFVFTQLIKTRQGWTRPSLRLGDSREPDLSAVEGRLSPHILDRVIASYYGQRCAIGGVAGMPGMGMDGVPGESPTGGVPGISVSGVPGVPGV